jgi:hypothetical protein
MPPLRRGVTTSTPIGDGLITAIAVPMLRVRRFTPRCSPSSLQTACSLRRLDSDGRRPFDAPTIGDVSSGKPALLAGPWCSRHASSFASHFR